MLEMSYGVLQVHSCQVARAKCFRRDAHSVDCVGPSVVADPTDVVALMGKAES